MCAEVISHYSYGIQGYELADHLKKCRGPDQEKFRKECFGKCQPKTGCLRKVPKKCFGVRASVETSAGEETRSTFFGTFLGTPFSAGTFRSTLFGTFPGRGLGTSLDGRQARKFKEPCPSFPWCFCFLAVFLPGNFLGLFECFLLVLKVF